jgi:dolichol kinase
MLELRRKAMHIGMGIFLIVLIRAGIVTLAVALAVFSLGCVASLISMRRPVPVISWFLKVFDRPHARPPGRGALTYMGAVCILMILFRGVDTSIIYASIMILALGDSFSSLVGWGVKGTQHLTKTPHPLSADKVLEGTFFGFVMASLGAMVFVSILEAVLASFAAMVIEGIDLRYGDESVDDNILIPLAAAATIVVVRFMLTL